MDDDLMSLRGGQSDSNDDDLFGSFSDPDDLGFDAPGPSPASADSFAADDPFDFSGFGAAAPVVPAAMPASKSKAEPAKKSKPKKAAKPKRKGASGSRGFMGLRPQEQMILSIFLFLDVAVFSFFLLLMTGAVK